ncbi:outer membrane beta-barrel protein [Paraneptunicella aestuarii]|uniref:outer membrane beta-barrel protein n=1 Tax=Paraneptunicella aestuarii TaxID=2831148 RepID=UPI001E412880|nr:outer membrane beta-barrel protein [Paraneptunicella aestuarii]UAA39161.1 outer membrane beta-barrel protein [Paraneptunicella aestuarii]
MIRQLWMASTIAVASFSAAANDEVIEKEDVVNNAQSCCQNRQGWYIGGQLGRSETRLDNSAVARQFDSAELYFDSLQTDNQDLGWSVFAGYQFNDFLGLETGYIDLGDRSVEFVGRYSDSDAYYDAVEHIYPQSTKGLSLGLVGSIPLSEQFHLSGKLRGLLGKGSYKTTEDSTREGQDNISDNALWYGLEANYQVSHQWQIYILYSHFKLSRDTNTMKGIGIRYYLS